jgi:hypothetical protein
VIERVFPLIDARCEQTLAPHVSFPEYSPTADQPLPTVKLSARLKSSVTQGVEHTPPMHV